MSKPKDNTDITLHCETCGLNHAILKMGELKEKVPGLDLKANHYKHGQCKECSDHLKAGGVFFVDKSGRCVKVSVEATKEKVSTAFHGKIICIPAAALNELIAAYIQAHPVDEKKN